MRKKKPAPDDTALSEEAAAPEVAGLSEEATVPEVAGLSEEAAAPEVAGLSEEAAAPEVAGLSEEAAAPEVAGLSEEAAAPDDAGLSEAIPLYRIVEAILFASQKPVPIKELSAIFRGAAEAAKENPLVTCYGKPKRDDFQEAIRQLEQEYLRTGRAFEVRESAAGWQLVTRAEFSPWLRQLFPENRAAKLSAPALETLAIIAYRQPITRADIEAVRGVAVDGVMQTLLDRGLVRIAGRSELPGRPLLYDTTQFFMEHFGLKNLDDLPNAGELRKISLPTAPPTGEPQPPAKAAPAELPPADAPPVASDTDLPTVSESGKDSCESIPEPEKQEESEAAGAEPPSEADLPGENQEEK